MSGSIAVRCRLMWSKINASPASKIGRTIAPAAAFSAESGIAGPFGGRADAGLDELVEPATDDIEPGRVVTAVGERQPDVERADVGAHSAVLVSATGLADARRSPERALAREKHWRLAEELADMSSRAASSKSRLRSNIVGGDSQLLSRHGIVSAPGRSSRRA